MNSADFETATLSFAGECDFSAALAGWQPTLSQQQTFQSLYQCILAGNQSLNLTRITAPTDFWEKHLWDSLVGVSPWLPRETNSPLKSPSLLDLFPWAPALPTASRVIDIGTGGGFPGVPVAIVRPDWQVTLLDATRKKMVFLESLVQQLGLKNGALRCDRAETLGQSPQFRQTFHLALIRAVGSALCCAEYALPLLEVGGLAILYRGEWLADDTPTLKAGLAHLGGALIHIQALSTPLTQSQRHCLYVRKVQPTPSAFPRPIGVPARHPIPVKTS